MKKLLRYSLVLIASVLIIWIVMFVSDWRVQNVSKAYEARSMQMLYDFRDAVDLDFLLSLEFTEENYEHPHFERLQRLIDAYHDHFPELHLFSLIPGDNGIFYGISNIHWDSMAPGQKYNDVNSKAAEVFERQIPLSFGPYEKNGEHVFTSLLPVNESITGEVKFLLGVDLLSEGYQAELSSVRRTSLSISIIAILVLLMSLAFLYWRNRQSIIIRTRFRHAETGLVGLLGLLLTLMAVMVSNDLYLNTKQQEFENQARQMTDLVHYELERIREHMRVTASFVNNSEDVSEDEFDAFTAELFNNSSIMSIAWAERIKMTDSKGLIGDITERDTFRFKDGMYKISKISFAGSDHMDQWRFDPQQINERDIELAYINGRSNASSPITVMENDVKRKRINVYFPVFERTLGSAPDRNCRGFVMASMEVGRTLDMGLNKLKWTGESASIGFIDMMPDAKPIILASFPKHHNCISDDEHFEEHLLQFMFSNRNPIFVFGRAYAIISHTSHSFDANMSFVRSWVVALAGLVMTILLTLIVAGAKNKRIRLETMVEERTKQLKERIKELTALKTINETIHESDDEVAVMSKIPLILNDSLQHPEQSNIEIEFNRHHYQARFISMAQPIMLK